MDPHQLMLANSFRSPYPERIEEYLAAGSANCCAYNRRGTLLAVGCWDGTVSIWDCDTNSMARKLVGHTRAVTNVRLPFLLRSGFIRFDLLLVGLVMAENYFRLP